jgi:hypothetical protein
VKVGRGIEEENIDLAVIVLEIFNEIVLASVVDYVDTEAYSEDE